MPSAQPAHRGAFWAALALCLCAGALRAADLLLFTDAATGFATAGPALARCAVLAAVLAALWWAGRSASACPAALAAPAARPWAFCLLPLLAALAAIASGTALVPALLTGLGLAAMAWRAACLRRQPPIALPALLALVWPGWLAMERVLVSPASVQRLPETLRVLSTVAVLAFLTALLRALYVPAQPEGQGLFRAGTACFLLCTCIELPQALYEAACGTARPGAVATALALGLLGLCGLAAAWYATGPGARA